MAKIRFLGTLNESGTYQTILDKTAHFSLHCIVRYKLFNRIKDTMDVVENKEKYNLYIKTHFVLNNNLIQSCFFYEYLKKGGETTWVLMTEETPSGEETATAEVLELLEKCTK